MATKKCLVVGHRGFKAKYVENTIYGFQQCFKAGATSFETDVWTTKDHVLVISHDVNTNRIFCDENGNETNYDILTTDYKVLKPLRTIASGEPLLRFTDILEWFVEYCKENDKGSEYKIMLDLKAANPPVILKLLIKDMLSVHPDLSWWFPRIQLGVWHLRFVKYLNQDPEIEELFKGVSAYKGYTQFDLLHIALNWESSMTFLGYNEYLDLKNKDQFKFKVTGISIIYIKTWSLSFVKYFLPALKKQDLALYSWTINIRTQLEYFRNLCRYTNVREYGIISDHPDLMAELCAVEVTDPSPPVPSIYKRIFCAILSLISTPLVNNDSFEAHVDPMKTSPVKQTLLKKFFAYLQNKGIF